MPRQRDWRPPSPESNERQEKGCRLHSFSWSEYVQAMLSRRFTSAEVFLFEKCTCPCLGITGTLAKLGLVAHACIAGIYIYGKRKLVICQGQ